MMVKIFKMTVRHLKRWLRYFKSIRSFLEKHTMKFFINLGKLRRNGNDIPVKQEIMNDNNHTFTAETRGNSIILSFA